MANLVTLNRPGAFSITIPREPAIGNLPYMISENITRNETDGGYSSCIVHSEPQRVFHFDFSLIPHTFFTELKSIWDIHVTGSDKIRWAYLTYPLFNIPNMPVDILTNPLSVEWYIGGVYCRFSLDLKEKFLRLGEGD